MEKASEYICAHLASIYDENGGNNFERFMKSNLGILTLELLGRLTEDNGEREEYDISYNIHPIYANNRIHSHNFFEIMYVYQGSCTQVINGKEITMTTGDLCLVNLQATHSVAITDKEEVLINLFINPKLFKQHYSNKVYDPNPITEFISNSLYHDHPTGQYMLFPNGVFTHYFQTIISEMIIELEEKVNCHHTVLDSYLSLLISYMVRAQQLTAGMQADDQSIKTEKHNLIDILSYINDHYSQITLSQLANHFHYNTSYLSSLIKKHTGKTFSSLINEFKINKACLLLANSDMGMDEICDIVGFYDHSHLHRVFKEQYQMSPSQYRNKSDCHSC